MKPVILLVLLLPVANAADDPLNCVDPDIVNGFLERWSEEQSVISRSLPADFVDLDLPSDYALIGSWQRETMATVVYKTERNSLGALSDVTEIFTLAGWEDVTDKSGWSGGGFQSNSRPTVAMVCRDTEPGVVTITATNRAGQTYLSLQTRDDSRYANCANYEEMNSFMLSRHLRDNVPVLVLPDDAQILDSNFGSNRGSNLMQIRISSDLNRSSLMTHLGDQIREQGWEYDVDWSGRTSSGSLWIKSGSERESLTGTLAVIESSPDIYNVQFNMVIAGT